jgi:hypothetical protein
MWGYRRVRQPLVIPILVWEKKRDLRFCVDYGKLNDVTRKGCFPLPQSNIILDRAKWFSSLTLKSGYWKVDLHSGDKKTAF